MTIRPRWIHPVLWSLAGALVATTPVFAQTTTPPATPAAPQAPAAPTAPSKTAAPPFLDRLFALGSGGIAVGDEHKGGNFGGDVGLRVAPHLQVEAEFGWLTNVTPNAVANNITTTALTLADSIGGPVTVTRAAVPVRYEAALVHATLFSMGAATPYVEAGVGEAHVTTDLSAEAGGVDISDEVRSGVTFPTSGSHRLITAGVGVTFKLSDRTAADVGYRMARIDTTSPRLNTSRVYGAVRVRF